jgi:hypothetical protein
MSYPDPSKGDTQGGMCPSSHPVALLHIGAEFGFDTGSLGIVDSSSLVWSMGDTTGYGGHGDFMQGWQNLTALGESFDNCIGTGADCAWNSFGTPNGQMGTKSNLSPQILPPYENIGFQGLISTLPGNNVVYDGSAGTGTSTTPAESSSVPTTMATVTRSSSLASTSTGIGMQLPPTTTSSSKPVGTNTTTSWDGKDGDSGDDGEQGSGSDEEDDGHDACEL